MSYKKGNGYKTYRDRIYPAVEEGRNKPKRRSFKQWLRDYLREEDDFRITADAMPSTTGPGIPPSFNKSFEGWNIRLHRANGGHIVEAWKNEDGPVHSSSYRPEHEMFMVTENEDMGASLNDILVQLMLRG